MSSIKALSKINSFFNISLSLFNLVNSHKKSYLFIPVSFSMSIKSLRIFSFIKYVSTISFNNSKLFLFSSFDKKSFSKLLLLILFILLLLMLFSEKTFLLLLFILLFIIGILILFSEKAFFVEVSKVSLLLNFFKYKLIFEFGSLLLFELKFDKLKISFSWLLLLLLLLLFDFL